MAAKSNGLVSYFLFKTYHNCYSNDHNSQAESNTNGSNSNGRSGNIFLALLKMDAFSYEIFEIQNG